MKTLTCRFKVKIPGSYNNRVQCGRTPAKEYNYGDNPIALCTFHAQYCSKEEGYMFHGSWTKVVEKGKRS